MSQPLVGAQLRQWRQRRRFSQLDLAIQTDISARHLSFVETGRARPSSEMILRLSDQLEVPLRDRNRLLLAGGFAPIYSEKTLDEPEMASVREAIRQVLDGHGKFPAVAVDQHWNLLDANAAIGMFTAGVDPLLLQPPANVLRLSLHPGAMAPRIVNLGQWRAHLLHRLRRQISATADPVLVDLLAELRDYPCDQPEPEVDAPGQVVVPLQIRVGGRVLSFVSITAVFGTPLDVALAELAIESFYPADPATIEFLAGHQVA